MKKPPSIRTEPTEAEIRHQAYLLWTEGGCRSGHEQDDWFAAREWLRRYRGRVPVMKACEAAWNRAIEGEPPLFSPFKPTAPVSVVPLTFTIGLCLVVTFIIFFLREHARGEIGGAERDSLLPFAEETPHIVTAAPDHENNHEGCGCRDGSRPPCHGGLKRRT
jgi:hypothetical protein